MGIKTVPVGHFLKDGPIETDANSDIGGGYEPVLQDTPTDTGVTATLSNVDEEVDSVPEPP